MSVHRLKRVLYIPDCHFPHVDNKAFRLMVHFATDFQPDEVVILGDFFDVACVSRFDNDPRKDHRFLSDELAYGISHLKEMDTLFPNANFIFLEGNHETRIKHYLFKNAPKLSDQIDMKQILGVPERWKYFPYGRLGAYRHGNWLAVHGTIYNKHVASSMVLKYGCNVIFGHVHRMQESFYTRFDGTVLKAMSPGWLGDETEADYIKDFPDWQKGFAVGYFKKDGKGFVQNVSIVNGELIAEGRLYQTPIRSIKNRK
jgi:hypothetical protein